MTWWFYLLVAWVPLLVLGARPSAGGVLIWTVALTWAALTFVVGHVSDDHIGAFAFFVMPVLVVGIATVIATSLASGRRRWFEAGFFALAGWWVGLMLMIFVPWSSRFGIWEDAIFVALPTVYGASGAAFGATNSG